MLNCGFFCDMDTTNRSNCKCQRRLGIAQSNHDIRRQQARSRSHSPSARSCPRNSNNCSTPAAPPMRPKPDARAHLANRLKPKPAGCRRSAPHSAWKSSSPRPKLRDYGRSSKAWRPIWRRPCRSASDEPWRITCGAGPSKTETVPRRLSVLPSTSETVAGNNLSA